MNDFFDYNLRHPLPQQSPRLTEADHDELFKLFGDASLPATTMSAEMADGYLTACVVGPVPVPAHEWMEAIFGQPTLPVCADPERQHRLLQLLLQRHRDIAVSTAVALHDLTPDQLFVPLTSEVDAGERITPYQIDENGNRQGDWDCKDWAEGFRLAMLDHPQWDGLTNNPKNFDLLAPIALFAEGYNPDQPELQIDEKANLPALLSLSIYNIRSFWKLHKQTHAPALREARKVGRNDPCPCGSGKKYKKCCGA
ncbi:MAG: UPF0149 family protein [Xanthomonadaceae bacterium]|nr:UPF0149 family protein [Xanthomonadaceae bacterium]